MRQSAVIDWSNYRMLLFIFLYAYAAYKILQQMQPVSISMHTLHT